MADLPEFGMSKPTMVFVIGITKLINDYSKWKCIFFTYSWSDGLIRHKTARVLLVINLKMNYSLS